eukprot:355086-Chlamydomonas_euryale.AAC.4
MRASAARFRWALALLLVCHMHSQFGSARLMLWICCSDALARECCTSLQPLTVAHLAWPTPLLGPAGKHWAATCTFSRLAVWGHDVPPSKSDPGRKALEFLTTASRAHAYADLQEVEDQLRMLTASRAGQAATEA